MSYRHQNPTIFSLYRVKFCGFVFVEYTTKSFKGSYPFADIPPSRIAEFIEENLTELIAEGIITLFFDFEDFPFDKAVVSERLLTHLRVRNFYEDGNVRQCYIQKYIKLSFQFRKKTEIAYKALFDAQGSLKALVHSTSPINITKYQSFDVAYNPKTQKPKNKRGKQ
jgi:hypothetical protein